MPRGFEAEAPAKANLALAVLGRRPDGYHDLSMLSATVSVADAVEVSEAPSLSLDVDGPAEVPRDDRNLAVVAARALAAAAGIEPRAAIRLVKRIPAAAGLGGGSADAAVVLGLLRALWRLEIDDGRLAEIGAGIGADVPFALAAAGGDGAAVVEGVGERVEPFRPAAPLHVVVANPGFPLSTPDVFAAWRGPARDRRADVRRLRDAWAGGRVGDLAAGLFNDLEAPALALRPDLARLAEEVRAAGVIGATMTGSGPTWIGIAADAVAAEAAAARLRAAGIAFAAAATAPAG